MRLGGIGDRLRAAPAEIAPAAPSSAGASSDELEGVARTDAPRSAGRERRLALGGWLISPAAAIAAGLAACLPVIESTVKAVRAGWVPAGDDGIIATRAWDVLTSHTPLVGQYSEAGLVIHGQIVHSPGPMLYWLLALPARLGSVASLAVTMCVANSLAIIGCVALARRRGGWPLMLACAAGIALMCQSLPSESMHDIWNPAAGLFPFLLLVFVGWSLACGERRLLPLAALLASFVLQTHLVYLLPTLAVLSVGLGGLLLRRVLAHGARLWPWALVALAVLACCWAEPVIQQVSESPGNLSLVERTVEHRGATVGAEVGWRALARAIGQRPWWLYVPASEWDRKRDVLAPLSSAREDSALALLAALALVGAIALAVRRADLLAAAVIALALCAAMFAQVQANPAAPLLRETLGYTLWWGSELGFWVWLVLAWSLWLAAGWALRRCGALLAALALRRRRSRSARPRRFVRALTVALGGLVLGGIVGVAAIGSAVAHTEGPDSHVYEYAGIAALAQGVQRLVPAGAVIDYRLGALDTGTQPTEPALRFLLVRHGDRVLAAGSYPRLGPYYVLDHRSYQWVVYLTDGARPARGMRLAARVRFRDRWGREVLSAWVERARRPPAARQGVRRAS